jgi:UbiD family decarboxylase
MRTFLKQLEAEGSIVRVSREVSPHLEAAQLIKSAYQILFEGR